jgi:xanthine dehydrogenase large subunit
MNTATDKVPNTSATAASSGSDLNGQAVHLACAELIARLRPVAAKLLGHPEAGERVIFEDGEVSLPGAPKKLRWEEVTGSAYLQQVSLAASAHYKTPDIHFDAKTGRGKPFHYYAWGAAVSEVEVNRVTGEHKLLRVDILHDVGRSLVPTIDRGQIEGGFVQGLGWLTTEEVIFDAQGQLKTHSPDTYKIPAIGDVPLDFRVALLEQADEPKVIHGSKAVGEPPLMLAISVISALRQAIAAFGDGRIDAVELGIPATPEAVLIAIERLTGPMRLV